MLDPAVFGQREHEERAKARSGPLLRTMLGGVLRRTRREQRRTLADVAGTARVSMQYLSELERGRKEASSEVLAAICEALGLDLLDLLAAAWRAVAQERAAATQLMRLRRVGFAPPVSASAGFGTIAAPGQPDKAAPTASAAAGRPTASLAAACEQQARPADPDGAELAAGAVDGAVAGAASTTSAAGAASAASAAGGAEVAELAEALAAVEHDLQALVTAAIQREDAAGVNRDVWLAGISRLSDAPGPDQRPGGEPQPAGSRPSRAGEVVCQLAA